MRSDEQEVLDKFGEGIKPLLGYADSCNEAAHCIVFFTHEGGREIQVATLGTFSKADICIAMQRYIDAHRKEKKHAQRRSARRSH